MSLAARALRQGTAPIAALARSVGYTSESAFSNAFKRANGKSPSAYRASVSGLDKTVPEQTNNAAPASETAF